MRLMPVAGAPLFMLALLLNGAGASFVDVAGAGRSRCRSRRALSPTAYSPGAAPDDDGVNSDPQQQQSTSVETLASLERCMLVANLETEIQVCEEAGDLRGAIAAYTALLLGFLCRGKPANCKAVLGVLGADDFTLVAQILRSFLELHSEAQLLSEEGSRAMTEIVDFLSSWRAE